jgi:hypothetical protein
MNPVENSKEQNRAIFNLIKDLENNWDLKWKAALSPSEDLITAQATILTFGTDHLEMAVRVSKSLVNKDEYHVGLAIYSLSDSLVNFQFYNETFSDLGEALNNVQRAIDENLTLNIAKCLPKGFKSEESISQPKKVEDSNHLMSLVKKIWDMDWKAEKNINGYPSIYTCPDMRVIPDFRLHVYLRNGMFHAKIEDSFETMSHYERHEDLDKLLSSLKKHIKEDIRATTEWLNLWY